MSQSDLLTCSIQDLLPYFPNIIQQHTGILVPQVSPRSTQQHTARAAARAPAGQQQQSHPPARSPLPPVARTRSASTWNPPKRLKHGRVAKARASQPRQPGLALRPRRKVRILLTFLVHLASRVRLSLVLLFACACRFPRCASLSLHASPDAFPSVGVAVAHTTLRSLSTRVSRSSLAFRNVTSRSHRSCVPARGHRGMAWFWVGWGLSAGKACLWLFGACGVWCRPRRATSSFVGPGWALVVKRSLTNLRQLLNRVTCGYLR